MPSPVGLRPIIGSASKRYQTQLLGRLVVFRACHARLIPNCCACRVTGSACVRSIIVLRSATVQPCRAPGQKTINQRLHVDPALPVRFGYPIRKPRQRLLALFDSQSHLRLESRTMAPACSLRHLISCLVGILAAFTQKRQSADCADLPRHLCQHIPGKQLVQFRTFSLKNGV